MKESEVVRLNDYLALRVMELESELELEKKRKSAVPVVQNTSGVVQGFDEHKAELMQVNLKYRTVTENYAKLKGDYIKLQERNAELDNVKGLRKLAYAYAKRGFWGLLKRILHV